QKQVEYLDSNPHLGVCGTLFQEFMDGNAVHDHMENVRYTDLLDGCYVGHPTAMFRRALFTEHNLFYNESLQVSEDYDLWTRAIRITEIGNVQENLLKYRRHGKNASICNVVAQTEHDVDIKVNMIDYLVGGASSEQKHRLRTIFRNENIPDEQREHLALDIIESIKYSKLCSELEMVSFLHRLKPFDRVFLRKVTRRTLHDLPIFVISFNHLTHLKTIVQFFQTLGARNVNIIDNNSTYQPLLDYFKIAPYKVHRLEANYGHMALFESPLFKEVIDSSYFVLTDPDILPVPECPEDFLCVFIDILFRHPMKNKVGFSLRIDDLPQHYDLRENVIAWESRFYTQALAHDNITIYDAPIDTTFALYRPRREWRTRDFYAALRVGAPYTARHLPWYSDLRNLSDEELFYKRAAAGVSNWNGAMSSEELHKKYGTGIPLSRPENMVQEPSFAN
ncbi:MAG TPA: hypothetical protein VE843_11740, partial [Ktedonobacteraceae bacterium]|nr:hypothetical protein [Ktedonobacteraceae bacterium]